MPAWLSARKRNDVLDDASARLSESGGLEIAGAWPLSPELPGLFRFLKILQLRRLQVHKFHIATWEFMPLRGLVLVGFNGNENNVGRLGSVESTMQALVASSHGSFISQSSRKPSDEGKENQLTMDVEMKTVADVEGTCVVTIDAEEKFGSDLDLRTTLIARSSSSHSQAMIQQTLSIGHRQRSIPSYLLWASVPC